MATMPVPSKASVAHARVASISTFNPVIGLWAWVTVGSAVGWMRRAPLPLVKADGTIPTIWHIAANSPRTPPCPST